MLCPSTMTPESSDLNVPTKTSAGGLIGNANSPPAWHHSWLEHVPLLGKILVAGMNASRYETTLEANAEFIASDLEGGESRWVGCAVGVITQAEARK